MNRKESRMPVRPLVSPTTPSLMMTLSGSCRSTSETKKPMLALIRNRGRYFRTIQSTSLKSSSVSSRRRKWRTLSLTPLWTITWTAGPLLSWPGTISWPTSTCRAILNWRLKFFQLMMIMFKRWWPQGEPAFIPSRTRDQPIKSIKTFITSFSHKISWRIMRASTCSTSIRWGMSFKSCLSRTNHPPRP